MILAGALDLLYEFLFEASKYIITLGAIILAVFIGAKLRKRHDAKTGAAALSTGSDEVSSDITNR